MKIENTSNPVASVVVRESRNRPVSASATAETDDVRLSELSAQVSSTSDESTFDTARVAQIKQSILDGSFKINAGDIADRLIASAKELDDAQRKA